MSGFIAKYDGTCADCKESIYAGDRLVYNHDGRVAHVDCERDEGHEERPTRPTCPKCWQVMSVTGSCGCDPA